MEWNEVKAKPKRQAKKQKTEEDDTFYGGAQGNKLVAGPVRGGTHEGKAASNKQASAIADYDFGVDEEQKEIKYEVVSHDLSAAVQTARLAKKLTQEQLAKAVNEKPSVIHDIENGTAHYEAGVINRIEKVLGVQIPRGRNNKKKAVKK